MNGTFSRWARCLPTVDLPEPGMPTSAQRICINLLSCPHGTRAQVYGPGWWGGPSAAAVNRRTHWRGPNRCLQALRGTAAAQAAEPVYLGPSGCRHSSGAFTAKENHAEKHRSHRTRNPVVMPGAAAAGVASPKWMWVAIGGLGGCVVALATVLVVERRSAVHRSRHGADHACGPGCPALASSLQAAPGAAAPWPARPRSAAQHHPRLAANARSPGDVARQPAGTPGAARGQHLQHLWPCGIHQAGEQAAPGRRRGGRGRWRAGRRWATRSARVTGAPPPRCWRWWRLCRPRDRKRTRTQTTYRQVRVRLEDGSSRVFTRSQPACRGTPVVLQGKGFRGLTRHRRRRSSPSQRPSTRRFRSPASAMQQWKAGAGLKPAAAPCADVVVGTPCRQRQSLSGIFDGIGNGHTRLTIPPVGASSEKPTDAAEYFSWPMQFARPEQWGVFKEHSPRVD